MRKYTVETTKYLSPEVVQLTMRPRGNKKLTFYPGQYASICFRRGGRLTPMRSFSMVSSPDEERLQFAIHVQGDFSATAAALQPGDEVLVQGPFGQFVIDERYDRRAVLFAGGIGITPYMSMLRQAAKAGSHLPITLLYSNHNQDEIPFFGELLELSRHNPQFRVIFFVTGGAVRAVPGANIVSGRIDESWIDRLTRENFRGSTYFLCGPNGFMQYLQALIEARGVNSDQIFSESFSQAASTPVIGRFSLQSLTYAFATLLILVGVGGIMVLDLDRALPELSAAAAQTVPRQSARSIASNKATTSSANTGGTPSQNSVANMIPTQTQQYQAPMTAVS